MQEVQVQNNHTRAALFFCVIAALGITLILAPLGIKVVCIAVALTTTLPLLIVLPMTQAIIIYLAYLSVDGAIKINTNYNPVFHVAQDLLMGVLLFKSCYGHENPGLQKFTRTPFFGLALIFLGWIVLQYFNPFGLGILPSIAGTKLYVSMFFLFLLIYHHVPKAKTNMILRSVLLLSMVQAALATLEYFYGQNFVMDLNYHYREVIQEQFAGAYYRPFGTSAVPGGPSIWIMLSAPIAGYLLQKRSVSFADKVLACLFIVLALPGLMVCQVRVAMLVTGAGIILPFLRPAKGFALRLVGMASLLAIFSYLLFLTSNMNTTDQYAWTSKFSPEQREILFNRMTSLNKAETYANARSGALDETLLLADKTLLGIGLSRVGAASAVWSSRIESDPYFGPRWSFADNLYKAVFTEIGLFGLASWLIFIFALIFSFLGGSLARHGSSDKSILWTLGSFNLVLMLIGLGSESILYNPVSAIFWTFQAICAKEKFYESD